MSVEFSNLEDSLSIDANLLRESHYYQNFHPTSIQMPNQIPIVTIKKLENILKLYYDRNIGVMEKILSNYNINQLVNLLTLVDFLLFPTESSLFEKLLYIYAQKLYTGYDTISAVNVLHKSLNQNLMHEVLKYVNLMMLSEFKRIFPKEMNEYLELRLTNLIEAENPVMLPIELPYKLKSLTDIYTEYKILENNEYVVTVKEIGMELEPFLRTRHNAVILLMGGGIYIRMVGNDDFFYKEKSVDTINITDIKVFYIDNLKILEHKLSHGKALFIEFYEQYLDKFSGMKTMTHRNFFEKSRVIGLLFTYYTYKTEQFLHI